MLIYYPCYPCYPWFKNEERYCDFDTSSFGNDLLRVLMTFVGDLGLAHLRIRQFGETP